ncbi:hypothetical protein DERP_010089 [Dermatophagoides pteronyssinus]|uniref:Uncharacterized protein n=1 Tax=Dermatophagoides pteronyssinus TaxID=6956 RepID=A0ABQ8JEX7_DERPT|nr:hypothetical protein DERP_010089 [Dermatophagoides pteronyssinus]
MITCLNIDTIDSEGRGKKNENKMDNQQILNIIINQPVNNKIISFHDDYENFLNCIRVNY